MVTCPSNALIDAVCTITPRWPSASGSFAAKAAADNRARLNGPHTCSWRLSSSISLAIIEPSRPTTRGLRMTTPVALTATENTPSARAAEMASATASSSLLSPATAVTRPPSSATSSPPARCLDRGSPPPTSGRRDASPSRCRVPPLHPRRRRIGHRSASPRSFDQVDDHRGRQRQQVISTPNGANASATALTTAAGAPIAPPSPTPLNPPGPGPESRCARTRWRDVAAVGRR